MLYWNLECCMCEVLSPASFATVYTATDAADGFLPVAGSKPRLKALCFDAFVKANRYRSAGSSGAYDNVDRSRSRFFGAAHDTTWSMAAAGELSGAARSTAEEGSSTGADDVSLELDGECHPRLTCAREASVGSAVSHVCGIAGCVCSHGQPLHGGMLAMPAPERFAYYDNMMSTILKQADVDIMYLDTGCTYMRHWQLYMPQDSPAPRHIRVPWWHARGHGRSCCWRNSGLYLPGGRAWRQDCVSCCFLLRRLHLEPLGGSVHCHHTYPPAVLTVGSLANS